MVPAVAEIEAVTYHIEVINDAAVVVINLWHPSLKNIHPGYMVQRHLKQS
jgi:hypothetical protein